MSRRVENIFIVDDNNKNFSKFLWLISYSASIKFTYIFYSFVRRVVHSY